MKIKLAGRVLLGAIVWWRAMVAFPSAFAVFNHVCELLKHARLSVV